MTDLAPVKGKYVTVVPHNRFFHHVVAMCLEHFDTPKRENTVILCDCDFFKPLEYYKQLYNVKKLIIYQEEQLFSPPKNQEGHTWIPIGTIVAFLKKVQDDEKKFLDGITEKYGQGSLNPETGVFTPIKS